MRRKRVREFQSRRRSHNSPSSEAPVLPPIAISETAKDAALLLIQQGYTQSCKGIECPLCRKKYLLLLDDRSCPRKRGIDATEQETALAYFALKIREGHRAGHVDGQWVMREAPRNPATALTPATETQATSREFSSQAGPDWTNTVS